LVELGLPYQERIVLRVHLAWLFGEVKLHPVVDLDHEKRSIGRRGCDAEDLGEEGR
jgi:hypothetical protein